MIKKSILYQIIFWLFFVLLFGSSGVKAQTESSGLKITPAFIEVVIEELGAEETIKLNLENQTEEELQLQLFPLDFRQDDFQTGIKFLPTGEDYSYSLVSYLKLASNSMILGPKEEKELEVTISDQQDLSPGGHYAAVVARIVNDFDSGEKKTTKLTPSLASLLLVSKKTGARYNLSLKQVSWPKSVLVFSYPDELELEFQNEGNIHLIPYGRVVIKDILGRNVYTGSINHSSSIIFPQSRKKFPAKIKKSLWKLPISINNLFINGQDSIKKVNYEYHDTFLYINPAALVVLLLGLGYMGWRWAKKIF